MDDEQVFNAYCLSFDDPTLTPVSSTAAERVRAGMAPLVSGQSVPAIWERVTPDDGCGCPAR